jgi:hypothetical protein
VPFVVVQAAGDLVAGEVDVGKAVAVDVADGDAGAVVDVDVGLDVQRVVRLDGVGESDAGLARVEA